MLVVLRAALVCCGGLDGLVCVMRNVTCFPAFFFSLLVGGTSLGRSPLCPLWWIPGKMWHVFVVLIHAVRRFVFQQLDAAV